MKGMKKILKNNNAFMNSGGWLKKNSFLKDTAKLSFSCVIRKVLILSLINYY